MSFLSSLKQGLEVINPFTQGKAISDLGKSLGSSIIEKVGNIETAITRTVGAVATAVISAPVVTSIASKVISNTPSAAKTKIASTVVGSAASLGAYSLASGSLPSTDLAKDVVSFKLNPVGATIGTVEKIFGSDNIKDALGTTKDALLGGGLAATTGEAALLGAGIVSGAAALIGGDEEIKTAENQGSTGTNPITGIQESGSGVPTTPIKKTYGARKYKKSSKISPSVNVRVTNKNYINARLLNKGW